MNGAVLRAVRQANGMPLRQLAAQSHFGHPHLSQVERGRHPVTPEIVAEYQRILRVWLPARPGRRVLTAADVPALLAGLWLLGVADRATAEDVLYLLDHVAPPPVRDLLLGQVGRTADLEVS